MDKKNFKPKKANDKPEATLTVIADNARRVYTELEETKKNFMAVCEAYRDAAVKASGEDEDADWEDVGTDYGEAIRFYQEYIRRKSGYYLLYFKGALRIGRYFEDRDVWVVEGMAGRYTTDQFDAVEREKIQLSLEFETATNNEDA